MKVFDQSCIKNFYVMVLLQSVRNIIITKEVSNQNALQKHLSWHVFREETQLWFINVLFCIESRLFMSNHDLCFDQCESWPIVFQILTKRPGFSKNKKFTFMLFFILILFGFWYHSRWYQKHQNPLGIDLIQDMF